MRTVDADGQQHNAREKGGVGRAVEPKIQAEDEQRVENRRGHPARQRDIHRPARVADAAQNAACAHAERHDRRRRYEDLQEARGQGERLAARAEQRGEVAQEWPDGKSDDGGGQAHENHRCAAEPRGLLAVAAAERSRNQRRGGDRETDRHGKGEEHQRAGEAHGRGQFLNAEQRDVKQIERIDGEDRHQPDRAGRRHDDDVAQGRTGGEPALFVPWLGRRDAQCAKPLFMATNHRMRAASCHPHQEVRLMRVRRYRGFAPSCRDARIRATA